MQSSTDRFGRGETGVETKTRPARLFKAPAVDEHINVIAIADFIAYPSAREQTIEATTSELQGEHQNANVALSIANPKI